MALKYISRVVDLDGNSVTEPLPASFFDGEQTAHMFTISARRGGQPVTLSGTVSATFFNANDSVVTLTGSISNGAAVVTLSNACYEVSGRFILTVSVAGAVIYECNSRIKRRQSSTIYDPTGELSPASIAQDIAAVVAATEDAEEATTAANNAVAGINGAFADITGNELLLNIVEHAYIPLNGKNTDIDNPTTSNSAEYLLVPCEAGDQFSVTTVGGSAGRAYGFVAANKTTVLLRADANYTCTNELVTAPENAAYFVANAVNSNKITAYKGRLISDIVGALSNNVDTLNNNAFTRYPTIRYKKDVRDNIATYFPNKSFNDAAQGTIYGIEEFLERDETPAILDGPPGDQYYGVPLDQSQAATSPTTNTGCLRGTLFTFAQALSGTNNVDGIAQVFVSYPGYGSNGGTYYGSVSPSINFRSAYWLSGGWQWSEWSKLSQAGVLHAGNGIVYGGQPHISHAPFTDLNNAPRNSIFHVDRNMNGSDADHTLGHHPFPGQSCMVITYAFSPGYNHCYVQVVHALNGRMAWRYEYLNHGEIWTNWYEVTCNRGALAANTNLNTIFDNSISFIAADTNYTNNPIAGAGFLTAKRAGDVCLQTIEPLSGAVLRRYTVDGGATWSTWA